ncbi:hypothetical protein N0V90_012530 [Kalmusia sp. IMI 367209]|nr:hypothetical protein N0V90_012530 [Kalmusia sp. IMI 367209]
MCMSIWDGDGLCKPDRIRWYPLEDVLAAWLDMIKIGKIKAAGPDAEFRPWELVPYTESQVDEAVDVFNKLLYAIESRIPDHISTHKSATTSLIDHEILDAAQIPQGFAYSFLLRARRPSFQFIAPGLALPTPSTIIPQPFFGIMETAPEQHSEMFRIPPLLLFRSSLDFTRPPSNNNPSEDIFGYPFNLSTYPAGLYFHSNSISRNEHADQVSLVLPYGIGSNGWARKSDGTLFGENINEELPHAKNMHTELYQTGHNPFIEMHAVRLVKVLRSWIGMVERGDWKVGERGVVSGIGEWKRADTRGGWEKYAIAADW